MNVHVYNSGATHRSAAGSTACMHTHRPRDLKRDVKLCAHFVEFDFKTNCDV